MLIDFRERGREGEREGQRYQCETEMSISCLSCALTGDHTCNLGAQARALTGD